MNSSIQYRQQHGTMDDDDSCFGESPSSDSLSSTDSETPSSLYDFSALKESLPFKRGLSKHYGGKSQSFTSMGDVKCLQDLQKPDRNRKRMKSSASYCARLDHCPLPNDKNSASASCVTNKPPPFPHNS